MQLTDLGIVIAERKISWTDTAGESRTLKVQIGKPKPFPDSTGYFAPYQIDNIGRDGIRYAAGIDAIQALQLVMGMIGADLFAFNQQCGQTLRWIGDESGHLGFPMP
jgi:uncharacterized protein DUF6968